jgi:alkanesulfonate monooxygenase SsuD/methylene tetrahydromethanopterin reductase-like flavin-dependent oxidoreductase (luciferase family)
VAGIGSVPEKRTLQIGLQLNTIQKAFRYQDLRSLARCAEEVGLDSIWSMDHLLLKTDQATVGPWEAFAILSALAEATQRIAIGTLVACTAFRNPAILAKQAVTLDEISGGRFVLGVGAGFDSIEYETFGIPDDRLVSRFGEAFTIVRQLIRGESVSFHGQYYRVQDCVIKPLGPRPGGPELMIGAEGERMLKIALPHVDGWNAWWSWASVNNSAAQFGDLIRRVDDACRNVGRDPTTVWRSVVVLVQLDETLGVPLASSDGGRQGLRGDAKELARAFGAFRRAGADHLQIFLDPPIERAIEVVGRAAELARADAD